MSDETITLYKISLFDVMMCILTRGLWMLVVYWQNGVELDASVVADAEEEDAA